MIFRRFQVTPGVNCTIRRFLPISGLLSEWNLSFLVIQVRWELEVSLSLSLSFLSSLEHRKDLALRNRTGRYQTTTMLNADTHEKFSRESGPPFIPVVLMIRIHHPWNHRNNQATPHSIEGAYLSLLLATWHLLLLIRSNSKYHN